MANLQRQEEILEYLRESRFASIAELSNILYISQATVRRDIEKLAALGAVKTVYGGVVLAEYENAPVPVFFRDKENPASKELIAERAQAKKAKNYARADEIRNILAEKGVTLIDTPQGTKYQIGG